MVLGRLINKVGSGEGLTTRRKKGFHNKLCDSADQNTFLRRKKSISFQYKLVKGGGGRACIRRAYNRMYFFVHR